MPEQQPTLISRVILIFEMQGIQAVERYAKANNIPLDVCLKIVDEYLRERSIQI